MRAKAMFNGLQKLQVFHIKTWTSTPGVLFCRLVAAYIDLGFGRDIKLSMMLQLTTRNLEFTCAMTVPHEQLSLQIKFAIYFVLEAV